MNPKYPNIHVQLSGKDGNAFYIVGKVQIALKKARVPPEEVNLFLTEATGHDYDHLLQTCMRWVSVD